MRICVTGGRDYRDEARVNEVLDSIHAATPIDRIGHGACETGADKLAAEWAARRGITLSAYPAQWDDWERPGAAIRIGKGGRRYDAAAGPRRNLKMLIEEAPEMLVVFPGGAGTHGCRALALRRDVAVMDVDR